MKNIINIIMAAAIVLSFGQTLTAQKTKPFQGNLTYSITYSGGSLTAAQKVSLPTVKVLTVKDCKTKEEITQGPVTQGQISDPVTKVNTILIDFSGTKKVMKLTEEEVKEVEEAGGSTFSTKLSEDTKVIAGYTCKKAILITKDEDGTVTNDTIYYSPEIGCKDLYFGSRYKDIPGAMLEYSEIEPTANIMQKFVVKEAKKSKVSDNVFLTPSDFVEVTAEEKQVFLKALKGEK